MSNPPSKRTKTEPGLGAVGGSPATGSTERKRFRDSYEQEKLVTPPPRRVRDSLRREEEDEADLTPPGAPPVRLTASWDKEATTGARPKARSDRAAVVVDEVGVAAVKLATVRRESAPRVVVSPSVIAKAPIDSRAAFVLSLIDGANSLSAIVDMSGMPDEEVSDILDRLVRLGLVSEH